MLGNRGIQEDVLRSDFVGHIRGDKTILLSEYRKSQDSVSGKDEVFVDCKKDAAFCYIYWSDTESILFFVGIYT